MAQPQTAPIGLVRPPPTFNPSPKTRFREMGDAVSKHHALLEQRELERALDLAVLEYQLQASRKVTDTNTALAFGYKMIGVQEFLDTFKLLAEVQRLPPQVISDNLEHRA